MGNTREMIRDFNLAFGRPVNDKLVNLTVTERELLGKLMLEECLEYVTLGLGLKLIYNGPWEDRQDGLNLAAKYLTCELNEGQAYDPVESADGLGDINVVAHFAALWHGFNLDLVTEEINRSNMSKLGEDGKPIINDPVGSGRFDDNGFEIEVLMDPSKPQGKILKGPNYSPPDLLPILGLSGIMVGGILTGIHEDDELIQPEEQ